MLRWVQRTERRAEAVGGGWFTGPTTWSSRIAQCTAWETALPRSRERVPEAQDAGKQGSLEHMVL